MKGSLAARRNDDLESRSVPDVPAGTVVLDVSVDEVRSGSFDAERTPAPELHPGSTIMLRPLSITPHGDEFLVGDPRGGEFVAMPAIGVLIIEALRDRRRLGEAAEMAQAEAGEPVDVVDFVQMLIDLGFVVQVDELRLPDGRERRFDGGRLGERLVRVARPLVSAPAWCLYGALFAGCVVLMIADARVRPVGSDLLFLHNPVESVAFMSLIGTVLVGVHELSHWLAARIEGIPSRITIGRRFYFLVFQTDLTGIWALPRRRRLIPLLAGMALDTVRLAALLGAWAAADGGLWHPSHTVLRLIMAVAAWTVAGIVFQFLIFMRTDLYAVLITWAGCLNLSRITQLVLKQYLVPLSDRQRDELAQADKRDLQVCRWYRWVYLAGVAAAAWFFLSFFAPNIVTIARWTFSGLARSSPAQTRFWGRLLLGGIALAPVPVTVLVFLRERLRAQ